MRIAKVGAGVAVCCAAIFIGNIIWSNSYGITEEVLGHTPAKRYKKDVSAATNKKSCKPVTTFVYAKTHKTGSSSVKEVLLNHMRRNKLYNVVLNHPKPLIAGYPGSFRPEFVFLNRSVSEPDVLCSHFRYAKTVRDFMNPKAKYITIIRDPIRQFESSYHFYYGKHSGDSEKMKARRNPITCHLEPYLHVVEKKWVTYSEYIAEAEHGLDETAPWFFRSRNYQAYDLGLDSLDLSEEYAKMKAKELDSEFDIVLILEYFLESLILLKDLFCMEWEDLVEVKRVHELGYEKHQHTEKEKMIIGKLTTQDQILYNYFNATFHRKVDAYGREKMRKDVETLKKLMKKAENTLPPVILKGKKEIFEYTETVPRRYRKDDAIEAEKIFPDIDLWEKYKPNTALQRKIATYMVQNYAWCLL